MRTTKQHCIVRPAPTHPRRQRDAGCRTHLAGREHSTRSAQEIRSVRCGAEVVAAADASEQRDEVPDARDGERQPLCPVSQWTSFSVQWVRVESGTAICRAPSGEGGGSDRTGRSCWV